MGHPPKSPVWYARAAILAVLGSAAACSLLVKTKAQPCAVDEDCVLLVGSHCDVDKQECVAGAPLNDGSSGDAITPSLTEPNWTTLTKYLQDLYDPSQSLLREFPQSTTFWTTPDNALAARALTYVPVPNTAMSESISKRLAVLTLCGCGDSAHGGDINHQIDPLIHKGAVNPIQPAEKCVGKPMDTSPIGVNACTGDAGPAGSCPLADVRAEDHPRQGFRGDKCISVCAGVNVSNWRDPGQGTGNADLIALWILSLRNRFQDPDAEELWTILSAKWDGKGMNDTATVSEGKYSTYKLALFKLVARVLEKPLPEGVDEKLTQAQAASGGIRALYSRDGFFTLDQSGNTVTTSMVAIAYLAPATDF